MFTLAVGLTVWFSIGGVKDMQRMFHNVKGAVQDASDNGSVLNGAGLNPLSSDSRVIGSAAWSTIPPKRSGGEDTAVGLAVSRLLAAAASHVLSLPPSPLRNTDQGLVRD